MSNSENESQAETTPVANEEALATAALETIQDTLDQFMATADVNAVFGETIKHQGNLILPAAEVVSFMGFGVGSGAGGSGENKGVGTGGGGGGNTFARPVAVIVANDQGVQVKPVVDFTKIYLTAFTTLAFVTSAWLRMGRGR
ncbi:MAG: spore germination protein GerW family protein [Bellilinea sp.]|nr:spore germination protein GerW family protein [Bellilinea sp.]